MPEFMFVHSTKIVGVAHRALKMYPVNFLKNTCVLTDPSMCYETVPCHLKNNPIALWHVYSSFSGRLIHCILPAHKTSVPCDGQLLTSLQVLPGWYLSFLSASIPSYTRC